MALMSGLITQEEFDQWKADVKTDKVKAARKAGKVTNYAAVYGSGAETLSRNSGLPLQMCKDLIEGYWKLNWAVKAIAEDQCVIVDNFGKTWLVNPINGFAYSLRSDKDRFSTLCQGTGSFFFDMWVDTILESMYNKFGVKRLNGEFHDEYITSFTDTDVNKSTMKEITEQAIETINKRYFLRRKLGCDVQFGYKYSDIH
jgi:DNA polymerase I-like protein with 3'-5' exonuclease and polymerase domains